MSTVNKFSTVRPLDPSHASLDGQARVNAEIFTAVEILGRKLERVEAERNQLAQRLALIESAATIDKKTGKLYLPAVVEPDPTQAKPEIATPKWMVFASLMSSSVALFAIGLVLFHEPAPLLTKEQVAALETLQSGQQLPRLADSNGWKDLQPAPESTPAAIEPAAGEAEKAAGASPELAQLEKTAQPVEERTVEPVKTTAPIPLVENATPSPVEKPTLAQQDVLIPGEDDKLIAKAAAAKAEPQRPAERIKNPVSTSEDEDGITPDNRLPAKLAQLEKRAYQGIPEAQHDLATLYASGKLVSQDYKRAIYWFSKAADGGVANAHYNLGVIYHQGLGVPVDMTQALNWYEKAAELGHPEAMYNLGIAYIEGVGTKADTQRGVAYFKRAAKAGVAQAAYNLGVLYESNFIGPIDTKKASEWYRVAASQGHTEAREALARLKSSGTATASQAATVADTEPAAGGEEYGEGDSSPASELRSRPVASTPKDLLVQIQRVLIRQGLLPGLAEGVMNQQTEDAIRAYQHKLGLPEDGQPTPSFLKKIQQDAALSR